MNNILKRALITEKSFSGVANNKYTFEVDTNASKDEVALACEQIFGVTVIDVNIANYQGKVKRGKKGVGRRSDSKKAFVTVKPGNKIDLFEIETADDKKDKDKK